MSQCPFCNQDHPADAQFCPVTGQKLFTICPRCGQVVHTPGRFCPVCGSPISAGPDVSANLSHRSGNRSWRLFASFGAGVLLLGVVVLAVWVFILSPRRGSAYVMIPTLTPENTVEPDVLFSPTAGQPAATGTVTLAPTASSTALPSSTVTITLTPLPSPTASEAPLQIRINPEDQAVLIPIPAGEFLMGSQPENDPYFWGAETPIHILRLASFWIYQTEVTNAMYQACVLEQACPKPESNTSRTRKEYYGNPQYANYPVIYVNQLDATAYCRWAGGRLPTEAEWEKAARGTDSRLFPWGDTPPTTDLANYLSSGFGDTVPVASYLEGASPYGVLDMAGNVLEWTADWFDDAYYKYSPRDNPLGPAEGDRKVIRGGSWYSQEDGIRGVARASRKQGDELDTIGFRCAFSGE